MSEPNPDRIAVLLAHYREQKATIAALEADVASTKAELDTALGTSDAWSIHGLGEIRRIPSSQSTSWDTRKLNVIIASLRVVGDDKLADQIEEARQLRSRAAYLAVKLIATEMTVHN
jgi:hypothetical protein